MVELPSHLSLGRWPVPVHRIEKLGGEIWCKREDQSGGPYGGNKVRKLEFLLAQARRTGQDVLTLGAVGSHHVLATALYGRALGVRVHALLVPQPDTPHVRVNARIIAALATSIRPVASPAGVPLAVLAESQRIRNETGRAPMFVPPGGSSALGTLGAIGLGREIAQDVAQGRLPAPDRIYVALGSGGTAAGLLAGLRLAGLGSEVVAVRVVPRWMAGGWRVKALAGRALALLGTQVRLDGLRVVHDQVGGGYGHPTVAAASAMAMARDLADLHLEPTYTGKAFAALLAERDRGGVALFVDTANSRPLDRLLASAPEEVPEPLDRLLA